MNFHHNHNFTGNLNQFNSKLSIFRHYVTVLLDSYLDSPQHLHLNWNGNDYLCLGLTDFTPLKNQELLQLKNQKEYTVPIITCHFT